VQRVYCPINEGYSRRKAAMVKHR